MSVKIERLNNLFVKELSEIMMLEVKNPIMKSICIMLGSLNKTGEFDVNADFLQLFRELKSEMIPEVFE